MKFPLSRVAYACAVFTVVMYAFELATISLEQDTFNALFTIGGFILSLVGPLAINFKSKVGITCYTVICLMFWVGDFVISILTIYLKTNEIQKDGFNLCMDVRAEEQYCSEYGRLVLKYRLGLNICYLVVKFIFLAIIMFYNIEVLTKGFPTTFDAEVLVSSDARVESLPRYEKDAVQPPPPCYSSELSIGSTEEYPQSSPITDNPNMANELKVESETDGRPKDLMIETRSEVYSHDDDLKIQCEVEDTKDTAKSEPERESDTK